MGGRAIMAENKQFAATEIVAIGIEIEKNGRDFYNSLAVRLKNAEAKKVFQFMAGEEAKHMVDFEKILSSVHKYEPHQSYPQDYFAYLNAIASEYVFTAKAKLKERLKIIESEKDAIEVSLGMEKDSIIFYEEAKKVLKEAEQQLVDKVIEQEKHHVKMLLDLKIQ
jgi:rubrerythrin